jgi:hypothetical protein
MNNRSRRFEVELKIVEEIRKRFQNQKTDCLFLNMKNGKEIEIKKLPTWNMSSERYRVTSFGYDYVSKNKSFYGEAEGLDGVAEIILRVSKL